MNETELRSAIEREIHDALGEYRGELTTVRAKAYEYFLGKMDPAPEGRSQVVSTDLAEVMDWIMPEIIRAFGAGEAAVEFAANGPEDENQAEAEAKAVNHVFFRENAGMLVLHDWVQETMLCKTGYAKVWWDDTPEFEEVEFEGLQDEQVAALAADPDIEILEHEQLIEEVGGVDLVVANEIKIKRKVSDGRLRVESVPSGEVLVNQDHRHISLQQARFAAHEREITVSELREMGYAQEEIDRIPSYSEDLSDEESIARRVVSDEDDEDQPADPSMRKVKLYEAYWLVDTDGDGIAERRLVHYAGKQFLQNEPAKRVGIIALGAFPMAGKHLGRSLFDKIYQIQQIKTALWRQIVDNVFLQNNGRHAIVEGQVNIRDMLNSRPGGLVRQKQPGMIEPLKAPPMGAEVFGFIESLNKVREQRTGVGPETVGALGDLANTTAWGVERLMAKKEELVGLTISIMRATGINELFEQIHALLRENHKGPLQFPMAGSWKHEEPAKWPERKTVPSVTWSGMGDRLAKQKTLAQVLQWQEKLAMDPRTTWMVTPRHIYESMSDFVKAAGMGCLSQYVIDPQSEEGAMALQAHARAMAQQQPGGNDPSAALIQIEQIKAQSRAQIEQLREANKRAIETFKASRAQQDTAIDMQKHVDEMNFKYKELEQRLVENMTKLEAQFARQIPGGLA